MFLSDAVKPLFANGKLQFPYVLTNCPVCNREHSYLLFSLRGFKHYICNGCGFIFVNPRLNNEGARIYYNSDYYRHYCDNNERPVNEKLGPFSRTLGAGLPAFAEYLRTLCPQGRIVDVGCGLGGLLASMSANSYERVGVEYNEAAAKFAREFYELRICQSLDELLGEGSTFDLVSAVEVIEHVADPLEFIRKLVQLLQPSGSLVITTPNIDSLDYRFYGKRCGHFCAPSHVNFFGLKTLTKLATNTGLKRRAYWYRGGVVNFRHWWRTKGTEVDFWSPEVQTRNSSNVVYRSVIGDNYNLPPILPFDDKTSAPASKAYFVRLLRDAHYKCMTKLFAQTQMVVVFQKVYD